MLLQTRFSQFNINYRIQARLQKTEIIYQIQSTNQNRQRNPKKTLPFDTLSQNNNFLNDASSSKTQISTVPTCQSSQFQRKIRLLQTKMKKLMAAGQNSTSQDANSKAIQPQIPQPEQAFDRKESEQLFKRVSLKEERQMLTSLSQKIEEILRRQKQNKEVLNKIQAQKQKSIDLNSLKNKTQNQNSVTKTNSRLEQSPNTKRKDSDIIEEIVNMNASLNASRVSNDSDMKSQKSDLSGSITSERHSEISRMTEQQKQVAYSNQIKNAKMMAKFKKRK